MNTRTISGRRTAESVTLLGIIIMLNLIGLVMVMSASSVISLEDHGNSWYYFQRQVIWAGIGTAVMLVMQRIDYHRWARLATPALLISLGLLTAVLIPGVGVDVNGARRWLGYGPVVIQPSELAKLALVLFCAALLGRRIHLIGLCRATLNPVLLVTSVIIGLVMLQPNLGTSIVLGCIALLMLHVAGAPRRWLGAALGVCFSGALLLGLAVPYRRARILAFMNPEADPLGSGYQTMQAFMAMAEGGLRGVGVGASRAKWGFLPFPHTDFIFAIIAEEFGFLGAALVIAIFALLALLGARAALRAPDAMGTLLAAGITGWFVVQALVNIGAVVGALPITGVPLPFVSSGGSSLVASMAACGLLLNVARQARPRSGRQTTTPPIVAGRGADLQLVTTAPHPPTVDANLEPDADPDRSPRRPVGV